MSHNIYGKYSDGSPIRLEETHFREYICLEEIFCEYFEKDINDIFSGRNKLRKEIIQALKELGYISPGKKYIGGYKQRTYYIKK